MPPEKPLLELSRIDDVTIIKFTHKRIPDETTSQNIGVHLFALIENESQKKFIIDFSNVEYISSTMLAKLVTMAQKAKEAKAKLRLCGMQPTIDEVFGMARLGKMFVIKNTREEALNDF